jgi:hypothetical protein
MPDSKQLYTGNNSGIAWRRMLRSFLVELLVYAVLVFVYFVLVLRFLGGPLSMLFHDDLLIYAFASLGLIVAQGSVLDLAVIFILELLGLDRIE